MKQQFAVYDSDTPATLKQGQGHQTLYHLVDPEQGYNDAKFEKNLARTVSVKKPAIKFLPNQKTHQLFPLNMCESQK